MNNLSQKIFTDFQARKSKRQKQRFIELITAELDNSGIPYKIQAGDLFGSQNIVVGSVEKADLIFTAHYDTAPEKSLPIPMVMTPNNKPLYLAIQIVPIAALAFLLRAIILWLALPAFCLTAIPVVIIFLLLFGKTNHYTANDNTSGVITLVEAIFSREIDFGKTAFVLFDNEEKGMWGAALFAKKYADVLGKKLVVNLDCVSDGDHIMIMKRKAVADNLSLDTFLTKHFTSAPDNKSIHIENRCDYLSDQVKFKNSIAVTACKRSKKFGMYISNMHTAKDTAFDQDNIDYLSRCILNMSNDR